MHKQTFLKFGGPVGDVSPVGAITRCGIDTSTQWATRIDSAVTCGNCKRLMEHDDNA